MLIKPAADGFATGGQRNTLPVQQPRREEAVQAPQKETAEEAVQTQQDEVEKSTAWEEMLKQAEEKQNPFEALRGTSSTFEIKTSPAKDGSGKLTKRLVSASTQFEVRDVIAQASKELTNLRIAAATSKGKEAQAAMAAIRKLEKLISRAQKKITRLNDEDLLKIGQKRAEQKKQQKRAEEIKKELRKKQSSRMAEENSYLRDATPDGQILNGRLQGRPADPMQKLDAATEARIEAVAEAQAAAEVAAGGGDVAAAGAEIAVGAEGGTAEGGAAAEGGAEVAVAEGGGEAG